MTPDYDKTLEGTINEQENLNGLQKKGIQNCPTSLKIEVI